MWHQELNFKNYNYVLKIKSWPLENVFHDCGKHDYSHGGHSSK